MKEELFSVILPVYNGEKYIKRAIESVICQNYNNWELIIVNDGSTDTSLDVCNSFKEKDSRIIVIDKVNTGVSDTRNRGLEKSKGKYVLFLDSDDWIEKECLSKMNFAMHKTQADLLIFNYYNAVSDNIMKARDITVANRDDISVHEIINASVRQSQWHSNVWYGNLRTVWGKCFKRDIIISNKLMFIHDLKIGEDMVFVLNYLLYSNKVFFSNEAIYNYFHNIDSVMNNRKWRGLSQGKLYFDQVEGLVNSLVCESAKADLWLETAEADWDTILSSNNSFLAKYKIFKEIIQDEYYIRFSENGLDSNNKQKLYSFIIKNNLALLLMVLAYCRMRKHRFKNQ